MKDGPGTTYRVRLTNEPDTNVTERSAPVGKSGRAANNARLAALKAEQARQERKRKVMLAAGTVGVVLLIVAALVIAKLTSSSDPAASGAKALDPAVATKLTTIPAATFDTVGVGSAVIAPKKIDGEAITANGLPRIVYVGAEYCPYCALERYPLVLALSRFGTFTGLQSTNSDPADNAGVPIYTLGFHGSTYTSKYVSFSGYETVDNTKVNGVYGKLDTLPDADQALLDKYNKPPYVDPPGGAIPWIYFGGKGIMNGAGVDKALLEGKAISDIATSIADPTSEVSKAVVGDANLLTAQICVMTNNQPAEVCGSSGVKAAAAKLGQ